MRLNSEDKPPGNVNIIRALNITQVPEGDHKEPSNAKSVAVQTREEYNFNKR